MNGHLEVVKLLVSHGANIQLRDKVSVTEVMRLCVNGLAGVLYGHYHYYCCHDNTCVVCMML